MISNSCPHWEELLRELGDFGATQEWCGFYKSNCSCCGDSNECNFQKIPKRRED